MNFPPEFGLPRFESTNRVPAETRRALRWEGITTPLPRPPGILAIARAALVRWAARRAPAGARDARPAPGMASDRERPGRAPSTRAQRPPPGAPSRAPRVVLGAPLAALEPSHLQPPAVPSVVSVGPPGWTSLYGPPALDDRLAMPPR